MSFVNKMLSCGAKIVELTPAPAVTWQRVALGNMPLRRRDGKRSRLKPFRTRMPHALSNASTTITLILAHSCLWNLTHKVCTTDHTQMREGDPGCEKIDVVHTWNPKTTTQLMQYTFALLHSNSCNGSVKFLRQGHKCCLTFIRRCNLGSHDWVESMHWASQSSFEYPF